MSSRSPFWSWLLSFSLPPCKIYILSVCMSPYIRAPFHASLSFVCVCLSRPSLQLCETSCVCVYSTWFTCSRRAGCQLQPHHFTSSQSDLYHCQKDGMSTPNMQMLHSWVTFSCGSCVWVCVHCVAHVGPFVPSLYPTSCVCWLYLCPSPGLPAPGEWTASRRTVTRHQICQTQKGLRNWDKQSLPLCQMGFCFTSHTPAVDWGVCLFVCFCHTCLWTQNIDCGLEST